MKRWTIIALTGVGLGILVVIGWIRSEQVRIRVPARVKVFAEKYEQITDGMTEEQVDVLLAGYPSAKDIESTQWPKTGKVSCYCRRYLLVREGEWWAYCISVYFDEGHHVVQKWVAAQDY